MRSPVWSATAVAVVLASLLLSGCSVRLVDPASDGTGSSDSSRVTDDAAPDLGTSDAQGSEPTDTATPAADDGLDTEHAAHRQELVDAATTTMPCPTGPLQQDGAVIRIEGDCGEITIDSDAAAVVVDDVSTLTLTGDGTVVYAAEVGEVLVSGSANQIYWTGKTPAVTDSGSANTLRRG